MTKSRKKFDAAFKAKIALEGPCCTDGAHRRGDANPVWGYESRT